MYPFEYVKTILQLHPARYRGMLHCFAATLRRSWLGLYQGLSPHLLFAFPRVAIRFSLYEALGDALRHAEGGGDGSLPRRALTRAEVLLAGVVAGFAEGALATVPLTTLSVRLCADAASPQPRFARAPLPVAMAALWREEGWRGWYRAPAATLLKVSTQISARFFLFEELSALLRRARGGGGRGEGWGDAGLTVAAGAAAGGITVLLNQPIDVVKSRLQAPGGGGGMLACARAVVAQCGVAGLYAGTLPRLVRVGGETGLTFLFYGAISRWLNVALDGRP